MSAHVLLNLLNELGKRDKMPDLLSMLYLFRNEFNKLNKRTRMKITMKSHFCLKNVIILSLCTQRSYGRITFPLNLLTTCGLSILLHGIISLPDATSCDNNSNDYNNVICPINLESAPYQLIVLKQN